MVGRINKFNSPTLLCVSIVLLVSVLIICLLSYTYVKNKVVQNMSATMQDVLDITKSTIEHSIQAKMQNLQQLAQAPAIIDFIKNPITESTTKIFLQKNFNLKPQETIIIFSSKNKPLFASDDHKELYESNEVLNISLNRSLILFNPDISDFFLNPILNKQMLFITIPIMKDNIFLGSLALEFPSAEIAALISNVSQLGKTGEILVGKKINNAAVIILPTRFNPQDAFVSKTILGKPYGIPLQQSVLGYSGIGIHLDYKKLRSLMVWNYIPTTQWGIVFKKAMVEVEQPFFPFKIIIVLISILSCVGLLYCSYQLFQLKKNTLFLDMIMKKALMGALFVTFIIGMPLCIRFGYNYYYTMISRGTKNNIMLIASLQRCTQQINYSISKVEIAAKSIAFNLSNDVPTTKNIAAQLQKELKAITDVNTIAVIFKKDSPSWQSVSLARKKNQIIEAPLDMQTQEPAWFRQSLKQEASWILPTDGNADSSLIYTVPFYSKNDQIQKEPQGIVALSYLKSDFIHNIQLQMGPEIKFFIATAQGNIIYQDESLKFKSYEITRQNTKIHLEKILLLAWFLGGISSQGFYSESLIVLIITLILIIMNGAVLFYYEQLSQGNYTAKNKALLCLLLIVLLFICIEIFITIR